MDSHAPLTAGTLAVADEEWHYPSPELPLGPETNVSVTPQVDAMAFVHGYLGSTSFLAPLEDHCQTDHNAIGMPQHTSSKRGPLPLNSARLAEVNIERIHTGVKFLELLPPIRPLVELVEQHYADSWFLIAPLPIVKGYLDTMIQWQDTRLQKKTELLNAAAQIFKNTLQPYKIEPTMTVAEFHALIAGDNLRWEVVGLVFTLFGFLSITLSSRKSRIFAMPALSVELPKLDTRLMVHASNECVSFCNFCEVASDPLLWLLHMNILLLTTCRGDTSKVSFPS